MPEVLKVNSCSGIFLVFGGFPTTVIESQVLVPVKSLAGLGINMDVWSFAFGRAQHQDASRTLQSLKDAFPSITIRLFRGVRSGVPFSDWINALLLAWRIRRLTRGLNFVHARTEYAASVAATAKSLGKYRVVWDDRGDSMSEFCEYAQNLSGVRKWRVKSVSKVISRRLRIASQASDAAIFVSEELQKLHNPQLPMEKTLIVPCAADESLFYFDTALRREARAAFGYSDKENVIVYVGSAAVWQCVPETISLLTQALETDPSVRAFVITPDRQVFASAFPAALSDRVHIAAGRLHEMNRYLNAADFGVMLKMPGSISRVASPVKFAEYSLAGLRVITSGTVQQVEEIGRELGNTVSTDLLLQKCLRRSNQPLETGDRAALAERARAVLGRQRYTEAMASLYRKLI